jgi:N-acetylmuramoyl-L-alanine amidase
MTAPRFILATVAALLLAPGVALRASGENASPLAPRPDNCDRASFGVILDVGHTADRYGAASARGYPEYLFNLKLARSIERYLLDAGFVQTKVLVTTEEQRLPGLFQRTAYANKSAAKLFLSIHHDSVPDVFVETWEYEGENFNFSDAFRGHSIFISHENADVRGSLLFGRLLGLQLRERGLQYTPHYTEAAMGRRRRQLLDAEAGVYRYDQLVVLRHTRLPAVLFEAGMIINRDEEMELRRPERRALVAAAVTDAVAAFCALRSPRPVARAAAGKAANPAVRRATVLPVANPLRRP